MSAAPGRRLDGNLFARLEGAGPWIAAATFALVALVAFFLLWGYYIVFEIVWNGQTPGKRALGIRVIRENGSSHQCAPV